MSRPRSQNPPPAAGGGQGGGLPARPTRTELRSVLLAALGVMLLTCVPYLIAAAPGFAGPGLHFQGFLWGLDDGNVYRSYIRQAATGHFFAADQYSTEPQNPHFANLLFLAMGLLCRLTGLSGVVVYHLFRVAGGVVLLYLLYLVAAEVGLSRRGGWVAFLAASFSSGLGWLVYASIHDPASQVLASRLAPLDVASGWTAMPEAVTGLTLLDNALFVAGVALMLGVVLWGLRAAREGGWHATLICGALLFVLGNVHSYDVVVLYAVLGVLFLAQALRGRLPWGQAVGRYAVLLLMGAPTVAWQYYVQSVDPIWAAKYLSPKLSPPLSGYLLGYGLVLLAALIGAVYALRQRRALLPVVWMVLGLALVYAPVNFQRKLAEGLQIPLCLLAGLAFEQLGRRWSASTFRLAVLIFLLLTVPSHLFYVGDGLVHASTNNLDLAPVNYPPAYLTGDELAGLRWLGQHATASDIVMSSVYTGSYVPAYAPCHVVAGHWDETVHFGKYLALTQRFFAPFGLPEVRAATLAETRADLVFYGPQERLLQKILHLSQPGGPSDPESVDPAQGVPQLREVFRQGEVVIYAVQARGG